MADDTIIRGGVVAVDAPQRPAPTWRGLLSATTLAMTAWGAILMWIAGEFIPDVAVFMALLAAGATLNHRGGGRAGPIVLLTLGAVILLMSAPFAIPDLAYPDSPANFAFHGVAGLTIPVAMALAALGTLRRWRGDAARTVALAAVGLIGLGAAISLGVAAVTGSDVAEAGDVTIVADAVEYPAVVELDAATTALYVENRDPIRHTFTAPELDLDVELPAGVGRRVLLPELEPGTYTFLCAVTGHERMVGELIVRG